MWRDTIIERKKEKNVTNKWIATTANLPERTVSRILSGETPDPSISIVCQIAYALDISLDELFPGSSSFLGGKRLKEVLTEHQKLVDEYELLKAKFDLINAENDVLKNKVASLTTENELAKMQLKHKEELLALHNFYNKLMPNN